MHLAVIYFEAEISASDSLRAFHNFLQILSFHIQKDRHKNIHDSRKQYSHRAQNPHKQVEGGNDKEGNQDSAHNMAVVIQTQDNAL